MKKAAALTLGMGMFAALASIGPAMAAGDAAAGEKIFNKCKICHRIGPGAKNAVGPELNGLDGRHSGSVAGYNYSEANKKSGITWNEETFKKYITNPKADIPGTKMVFAGLPKAQDRDDLWAYLAQFKADGSKK
ncbi:MAG: cytochrome c family protein [Methylobacteriaceae bacterium]|nr:cytochrome c family protein [Methylobacteriaceae bacterium]